MEESDQLLVARFTGQEDEEAFRTLFTRYGTLVYSTCRRVLGDESQAADAAQETFLDLRQKAETIRGPIGSWLHQVATRRAVDIIRSNASRRRREQAYVAHAENASEHAIEEVQVHVDQALGEIPDSFRELIVLYYLEKKSMPQIAAAKGISQPTVSRRLAEGLQQLRARLQHQGIVVAAVPLQGILLHSTWEIPNSMPYLVGNASLAGAAGATAAPAAASGSSALVGSAKIASWCAAGALLVSTGVFLGQKLVVEDRPTGVSMVTKRVASLQSPATRQPRGAPTRPTEFNRQQSNNAYSRVQVPETTALVPGKGPVPVVPAPAKPAGAPLSGRPISRPFTQARVTAAAPVASPIRPKVVVQAVRAEVQPLPIPTAVSIAISSNILALASPNRPAPAEGNVRMIGAPMPNLLLGQNKRPFVTTQPGWAPPIANPPVKRGKDL